LSHGATRALFRGKAR